MWVNFNGPLEVGGSGSTQITAGGYRMRPRPSLKLWRTGEDARVPPTCSPGLAINRVV